MRVKFLMFFIKYIFFNRKMNYILTEIKKDVKNLSDEKLFKNIPADVFAYIIEQNCDLQKNRLFGYKFKEAFYHLTRNPYFPFFLFSKKEEVLYMGIYAAKHYLSQYMYIPFVKFFWDFDSVSNITKYGIYWDIPGMFDTVPYFLHEKELDEHKDSPESAASLNFFLSENYKYSYFYNNLNISAGTLLKVFDKIDWYFLQFADPSEIEKIDATLMNRILKYFFYD